MKECWYESPEARLTALRIKKTVASVGLVATSSTSNPAATATQNAASSDSDKQLS